MQFSRRWATFSSLRASDAQSCGKTDAFDLTEPEYGGKLFSKMDVFDRTEPDYGGKLW